jgi:hypothetical protein
MARREYYHRPQCAHEGCAERALYVFGTRREQSETVESLRRRGGWRCVRHTKPDDVLATDAPARETTLVSYEKDYGQLTGVKRFWRRQGTDESGNGFVYGPGFKAFAGDFPAGTRLVVSARIEPPQESP